MNSRIREEGIAIQTNKPLVEYSRISRQVEDFGFDVISVYDDLSGFSFSVSSKLPSLSF